MKTTQLKKFGVLVGSIFMALALLALHKNKNTTSCALTSTASLDGEAVEGLAKFEIDEGSTEEFTLTVVATAQADHTTQVLLNSINWTTQPDEVADLFFNEGFGPLSEFKTNTVFLNFY